MLQRIAGLLLVALLMTGCGGSGSSSSSSSTPGQAQGVFFGTTSTGKVFESIVLPSDKFYALYGCSGNTWCPTSVDNTFWMDGFVAGQGNSNNGTYTASTIDYYYGSAIAGSVNASYVAGASFQGSLLESGSTATFTGSVPAGFNFNTAARLSDITGTWSGALYASGTGTATVISNGTFAGSDNDGCSFSGSVSPDASGKNFFDVTVTFGPNYCAAANQTVQGIAVDYLLSNGVTRQLVVAVNSGNNGTVFMASR